MRGHPYESFVYLLEELSRPQTENAADTALIEKSPHPKNSLEVKLASA
jgi:hypothetical protein